MKQALFLACLPFLLVLMAVDWLIEHLIVNRRYKPIQDDAYAVKLLLSLMMNDINRKENK